jgi:hypothetical protein
MPKSPRRRWLTRMRSQVTIVSLSRCVLFTCANGAKSIQRSISEEWEMRIRVRRAWRCYTDHDRLHTTYVVQCSRATTCNVVSAQAATGFLFANGIADWLTKEKEKQQKRQKERTKQGKFLPGRAVLFTVAHTMVRRGVRKAALHSSLKGIPTPHWLASRFSAQ